MYILRMMSRVSGWFRWFSDMFWYLFQRWKSPFVGNQLNKMYSNRKSISGNTFKSRCQRLSGKWARTPLTLFLQSQAGTDKRSIYLKAEPTPLLCHEAATQDCGGLVLIPRVCDTLRSIDSVMEWFLPLRGGRHRGSCDRRSLGFCCRSCQLAEGIDLCYL